MKNGFIPVSRAIVGSLIVMVGFMVMTQEACDEFIKQAFKNIGGDK